MGHAEDDDDDDDDVVFFPPSTFPFKKEKPLSELWE